MSGAKDWVGNASMRNCNIRNLDSEEHDYYATEPMAVQLLLESESFGKTIWEPACGEGHISKVLEEHGYQVVSTDLIDRGYGKGNINFLETTFATKLKCDIITNPPYKYAKEFVEHALDQVETGCKVAMFLKLTFLEGQGRRDLFRNNPPKTVYVCSGRLQCGKNGDFTGSRMVAYAWFVWEKDNSNDPIIKWIN